MCNTIKTYLTSEGNQIEQTQNLRGIVAFSSCMFDATPTGA